MNFCNAPFCPNPKYIHKGKSYGYCSQHISQRMKYKVKAYKELLPLWAFKRCQIHGLLNYDQVYPHYNNQLKKTLYDCMYCSRSYKNKAYCPIEAKAINAKKASQKRNRELKCVYGITLDEYNEILKSQNYSCAICRTSKVSPKRKSFDVDHCHTTKKVRGLLCHSCNVGIGFLKDDVAILKEAIRYLSA